MRRSPTRDFAVGLFVLAGLAALAYMSLGVGGFTYTGLTGLDLHAEFDEIGGLKPRAPVVISGVKVGVVENIRLDKDYRARVDFTLDPTLKLPADTTASIVTSGLLGDRYVSLQPGGDEQLLGPGDRIEFVESAFMLERMIGKLIHNTDIGSAKPDAGSNKAQQ